MGDGVLGVGRRALRARSWRLADERRDWVFEAEGGGLDWSSDRMLVRAEDAAVLDVMAGWLWNWWRDCTP